LPEIVTVGPAPKPAPLSGRQRVRIMRACRIAISGHEEQKLEVGLEVELPGHIWPSLVVSGAAVTLSEPAGSPEPPAPPIPATASPNGGGASPAAPPQEPPPFDPEAELPEAKRKSRLVKREG